MPMVHCLNLFFILFLPLHQSLGGIRIYLIIYILSALEGLAPYGGQTSSSCGGLVALGHQMGALWATWVVKLKSWALYAPPSSS